MDDKITFTYTRELLEDFWKTKITDEQWAALKDEKTGFQEAVDSEVEQLREYVLDELNCSGY